MPTYAYTCRDCGRTTEAVQAFTDASLTVCPYCGGRLRKQYGSVGVTFNGSGFYRTDSRADAAKGSGAKPDSGGTSGESKPTESKPAAASAGATGASGSGSAGSGSGSSSSGSGSGSSGSGSAPSGSGGSKSSS